MKKASDQSRDLSDKVLSFLYLEAKELKLTQADVMHALIITFAYTLKATQTNDIEDAAEKIRQDIINVYQQLMNPGVIPQPISEREKVSELIQTFEECLNHRPHLVLEIGYNRVTDWMVHVYDATGVGIKNSALTIATQESNPNDAAREAIASLREKFLPAPQA